MTTKLQDRLDEIQEVLLCEYCGNGPKSADDWQGCCGESSAHFGRHHAIFASNDYKDRYNYVLVDPATGEETDDLEISRITE